MRDDWERCGIRVSLVQIDVGGLEISRREDDAAEDRRLEVRHVPADSGLDPIGVALSQRLRPRAVTGLQLTGSVSLHAPRQLLQLNPEQASSAGCSRLVDGQRLADDD